MLQGNGSRKSVAHFTTISQTTAYFTAVYTWVVLVFLLQLLRDESSSRYSIKYICTDAV